jgi:hypothetical protein
LPKRSGSEKRVFHTKQKPKPRLVSKAHLQERAEDEAAAAEALQRAINRPNKK